MSSPFRVLLLLGCFEKYSSRNRAALLNLTFLPAASIIQIIYALLADKVGISLAVNDLGEAEKEKFEPQTPKELHQQKPTT
jgi:hypothetical protein